MTARDAIRQLVTDGLVVSRQGKGAYVLRQPPTDESLSASHLLDLVSQVRRSLDDLTTRMTVVERTLADHQGSTAAPPPPSGD